MKRYFVIFLFGLFLFPAITFASDKDSLGLAQSTNCENYTVGTNLIGLSNYKIKTPLYRDYKGITSTVGITSVSQNPRTWFRAIRFSGWARFYPFYRHMDSYYDIPPTQGLTLPVNLTVADGYQQPLMLFRLEATPSAKTWFQTELQFDHLMLRTINQSNPYTKTNSYGRYANLYVLFQMQGVVETSFGKFKMIAGGGANWYRLSPSTLWGYQYRDDLFERYPWDPEGHDFNRYNSAYSVGDIPRDQRFGMQATQGFILEGTNLPAGFDAAVLYGKTATGAFQSFLTRDALNMFAGRVGKRIGDHKIGYNFFSQYGYRDSNRVAYTPIVQNEDTFYVESNRISQIITTVDGRFDFGNISIFTEVGVGSILNSTYNRGLKDDAKPGTYNVSRYQRDWDETVFFEISTKKQLTYIPLKLGLYRIGPLVVNNSSSVANTSVEQAKPSTETPDEYYTNYYDGLVTDVGQLANNRQGLNFFANKDFFFNKIKTKLSIGMAQEVENLAGDYRNGGRASLVTTGTSNSAKYPFTNSITFEHKLNGLTRSRFALFKRFEGPYRSLHNIFRRGFENLVITDDSADVDYKKSFSTLDFEAKYKFNLFGKEMIMMNYNSVSTVQENWSPIPVWNNKAFLRYFYEEFMTFYAIHQKVTLVGFVGFERTMGNNRTAVVDSEGKLIMNAEGRPVADPDGKPINQTGHGYGLGFDYNFHSRASLHLRHRWFDHKDKNFKLDKFKGNEMTVEFKLFF